MLLSGMQVIERDAAPETVAAVRESLRQELAERMKEAATAQALAQARAQAEQHAHSHLEALLAQKAAGMSSSRVCITWASPAGCRGLQKGRSPITWLVQMRRLAKQIFGLTLCRQCLMSWTSSVLCSEHVSTQHDCHMLPVTSYMLTCCFCYQAADLLRYRGCESVRVSVWLAQCALTGPSCCPAAHAQHLWRTLLAFCFVWPLPLNS